MSILVPLLSYSLAAGSDVASTRVALQRPNVMESNGLLRGQGRLIAGKALQVGALTAADAMLQHRPSTRKWVWVLRAAYLGWNVRAAVQNMRVGK